MINHNVNQYWTYTLIFVRHLDDVQIITSNCSYVFLQQVERSLWVHGDKTVGIQWGYSEGAVRIQWGYSGDTVRIQCGYSKDTVRIQ